MAIPSPIKINKNNVEYVSSVDRAQYTLRELSRAALRDVAKFIRKRVIQELKKMPGMKKSKRPYNSSQFWLRKQENDLQIGIKHDSWYGVNQELGSKNQPKRGILLNTVMQNIDEIRRIEGAYIKEIENENRVLGLIDESEAVGSDDEI